MPSRRAVFDIGVAGPIAGFIALIPIAFIGIWTMEPAAAEQLATPSGLVFADPLFMRLLGFPLGHDPAVSVGNAFYFAGWVGLLVTALNLIPSGQLDGGHAIYAVFGETVHKWTGRIAFPIMATLSIVGLYFFGSPSGFLIAIILGVMMCAAPESARSNAPRRKKEGRGLPYARDICAVFCTFPNSNKLT